MSVRTYLLGATALAISALPALGDGHATRGSDGQVNIIYWQAPSILNPYLSGGTKELEAASLVIEPLARYNEVGEMVPFLVDEIPTVANGGVSEDLTSITWTLSDGILWSDGTPMTAEDVVFTWQYCTDPDGGCAQASNFTDVTNVEALDDSTVKVTFGVAKPFPYGPFVGAQSAILQKAQFADCMGAKAVECTEQNFAPIGTGPFVVADFKANDVAVFEANPNYRDPSKPAFQTVLFKGGGDAAAAARSVLETGEFDYAWNLQVEPEVLSRMEAAGKGTLVSAFGTSVERLMVNQTNPDPALGDERATLKHPHPFLTDTDVTKALSLAIERSILVEAGYGSAGQVTCNVLPAPAAYNSTNNDWCKTQDVEAAKALLDGAGWVPGADGVREKDGVRLSVLFQTSTNSVRQGTQALIKQMWAEIGVETELRNIDASVFFGGDQSSPDTFQKFFADIEMYTNNFDGTDPEKYMANWACSEIPSPENQWLGDNMPRFCDPAYEALVAEYGKTAGLEDRAAIAIKMNDMLMNAGVIIPLIHRGGVSAHANSLEGVKMNEWDSELWNIADWTRAE
ncbi:MAG: peptide ABC transporter substrate-binding protein [Pseudomonadota bacterium]